MNPIPLITSIPGKISRIDNNGEEIGGHYLGRCLHSWKQFGFSPISVNSQREFTFGASPAPGIDYKIVNRDAFNVTGKALVYLSDMLRIAQEVTDGPVAISNADILLETNRPLFEKIQKLKPGELLVAKRYDIDSMESRSGMEYSQGYDFFAFNTKDTQKYEDKVFAFGAPWWDHYFPLCMAIRGIKIISSGTPFAFHLIHEERWDPDLWIEFGIEFIKAVKKDLSLSAGAGLEYTMEYANEFKALTKHFGSRSRLKLYMNRLRGMKGRQGLKDDYIMNVLSRLATLNYQCIDTLALMTTSAIVSPSAERQNQRETY